MLKVRCIKAQYGLVPGKVYEVDTLQNGDYRLPDGPEDYCGYFDHELFEIVYADWVVYHGPKWGPNGLIDLIPGQKYIFLRYDAYDGASRVIDESGDDYRYDPADFTEWKPEWVTAHAKKFVMSKSSKEE